MQALKDYLNKFVGGRFVIVGKGPTPFDFSTLGEIGDPVIFINDAVQFAPLATRSRQKFFFALDARQALWLKNLGGATPVLASGPDDEYLAKYAKLVPERLFTDHLPADQFPDPADGLVTWKYGHFAGHLMELTRDEIARRNQLTVGFKGTIAPAIHFAWLCGAREIAFIGCDGNRAGYDPRIEIASGAPNLNQQAAIRANQDRICADLGLETEYVAGPRLAPRIPRRMNFAWFGPDVPGWVVKTIEAFRADHPAWHIRLWRDLPDRMAPELRRAAERCDQWCQWADLLYLHLLYDEGGFVMDTDSICVRSFEPLRAHPAFTTRHRDITGNRLTNGVMGSAPRSPAAELAMRAAMRLSDTLPPGEKFPRCSFGPTLLTELFGGETGGMTILPHWYFYPFRTGERELARQFASAAGGIDALLKGRVPDGERPYAVHLWGVDDSSHTPVESALAARLAGRDG